MRKLWCLVKVDFRAMLAALNFGRSKKGRAGGIGTLVLLTVLPLYLSGVYSFLLGEWMSENGALGFLMPVMALLGIFMTLMFTMFGASGIVYGGRDMDLMLSLPVPAFSVMLAKLLALYLENLVFCGLWLIPAGAALGVYGGVSLGFILSMALAVLFTPFLPALLGALIGWLVAFAEGRLRRKALVASLLYLALFGILIAGGMQVNRLAGLMMQNAAALQHVLNTWLLPMGLLQSALAGSFPALLGYLAVCLVPFLAAAWLLSLRYKAILTGLSSRAMGKAYRLSRLGASGQFAALYKKELARFFGTPIYLFNTGIGFIMLLGAGVYAVFARRTILEFAAQVGGIQTLLPAGLLAVAFMVGTFNTTCVSISLEGRQLWVLKEAPIPAGRLFRAKVAMNLTVAWPSILIGLGCIAFAVQLPLGQAAAALALCLALSLLVALAGLCVNLLLPKLDGANDTLVVKQSASAFCGIFGGMGLVGLGALCWVLFGSALGFSAFCAVFALLALVLSAGLWYVLNTWGARRFSAL